MEQDSRPACCSSSSSGSPANRQLQFGRSPEELVGEIAQRELPGPAEMQRYVISAILSHQQYGRELERMGGVLLGPSRGAPFIGC